MTPRWLSAPFLLFIGGDFLTIAYHGCKAGKVPLCVWGLL